MMKFFFMLFFMLPMCFKKKFFWMIQLFLFFFMLMFILFSSLNILNFFNISFFFSMDILSYGMILLSIWICSLMIMSSESLYKNNFFYNMFLFNVMILLILLIFTFSSMNLFMFYLFFEGSLIPTLMLIMGWGYQPERIQASIYLLFYTLFMSLPMFMGIIYLFNFNNSLLMYFLKFYNSDFLLLYFCMLMAFLVKMPMYFVHLWLPKAHVEAPVSGSMILAGVMLKLGGYGMMRLLIIFQNLSMKMNLIWVVISLLGGFYISLKCFCQVDLKSLIAYSSVAHMSLVIGGLMTLNYWGMIGSYILMLGHGLCSSGLFCLANINYERLNSRSLFINKGLMNLMPSMSLWWFLLLSSNMAAPPSLNLMGEISLINSLISWSTFSMLMLMLISFFSAGYSLYLFSYTQHGKFDLGVYSFYLGCSREYLILFLHWFPLNLIVLKIDLFMIWF